MEAFVALFAMGLVLALLAAPVLALAAYVRVSRLSGELEELRRAVGEIQRSAARARGAESPASVAAGPATDVNTARATAAPASATPATAAPTAVPGTAATAAGSGDREPGAAASPAGPAPVPAGSETIAAPPLVPAPGEAMFARPPIATGSETSTPPPGRPRRPTASSASADFVTSIGPRLLVAAGGLAVVVFLGFFVRYAWENDWVGPTGRVLSGAFLSLGLVAAGLRMLGRQYRPLGQGLTAAGLSGLYVTAFAAHAVYGLVPRSAAAAFMVVVTGCAVALADRLAARLLAALAWTGGYLTPILLSTGEDRAESLIVYLLLLGAGAMWLDRRQTWPETLPIALVGSAFLYGGWYAAHFRPERFFVAAAGLVLLSALFALGSAAKERRLSMGAVAVLGAIGLAALAFGADRPEILLVLSLALAAVVLRTARLGVLGSVLLAPFAIALPFLFWAGAHYRTEAFGIAAAWVALGSLLLALLAPREGQDVERLLGPAVALVAGGLGSIGLAIASDRPLALLGLLAAQAGLAVLVRRLWPWAEAVGAALGALAVWAWFAVHFDPAQAQEALVLASTLAGIYFLVTTARGLLLHEPLGLPGTATHLVAAALAWGVAYRVLTLTAPGLLGPAAVVLAALHLAVGLAARASGRDPQRTRVTLGLAAGFLTIAIPVQLGLHGITLAWAVEGLVLLWLGLQQQSWLTRAAGYLVLALAVGRLFYRHLPLHEGAFVAVRNPAFGVWLAVIVALAGGWWLAGRVREKRALDEAAAAILAPAALALLFGLLTMETQTAFAQQARDAIAAGDAAAGRNASLQGDLAVSVLWTVFATGLLAGGLGLRSRGLFYAAYGLFAITAGKVVLVDLANLPTLYRMLSFLALGVLLLAGAWLNLRFRERLSLPDGAAS